eukprot:73768_1
MQFFLVSLFLSLFHFAIAIKNDTIVSIHSDVLLNEMLPWLANTDLERFMQCSQWYRQLCHQYLQTHRPTFLTTKRDWHELMTFVERMTEDQSLSDSVSRVVQRLNKVYDPSVNISRYKCRSMITNIEQILFIILANQHISFSLTRHKIGVTNTIVQWFGVDNDFDYPVIAAMVSLINKIECDQNVYFYHYLEALQTVFRMAQNQFDQTNSTYNRYTIFGLYCIDILSRRLLEPAVLWIAVQAEFIPHFLQRVPIDHIDDVLHNVCEAIFDNEFYGKNNVKYLDLFAHYKHELLYGNEWYILSYALQSKYYRWEHMKYLMQFFIDNQLMSRACIKEIVLFIENEEEQSIKRTQCLLWLAYFRTETKKDSDSDSHQNQNTTALGVESHSLHVMDDTADISTTRRIVGAWTEPVLAVHHSKRRCVCCSVQ